MDDLTHWTPAQWRQFLRSRRREIIGMKRTAYARYAAQYAEAWLKCRLGNLAGKKVALFLSLPEEIDTMPLIDTLRASDTCLFLPCVAHRAAPLHWQPYHSDTILYSDCMGIPAPADRPETRLDAMALDAAVIPLTGWHRNGYRIGMGGGFYDRSFAAKITHRPPYLLGYAYACQEIVHDISFQPWDVPLDGLANETGNLSFTGVTTHATATQSQPNQPSY